MLWIKIKRDVRNFLQNTLRIEIHAWVTSVNHMLNVVVLKNNHGRPGRR